MFVQHPSALTACSLSSFAVSQKLVDVALPSWQLRGWLLWPFYLRGNSDTGRCRPTSILVGVPLSPRPLRYWLMSPSFVTTQILVGIGRRLGQLRYWLMLPLLRVKSDTGTTVDVCFASLAFPFLVGVAVLSWHVRYWLVLRFFGGDSNTG